MEVIKTSYHELGRGGVKNMYQSRDGVAKTYTSSGRGGGYIHVHVCITLLFGIHDLPPSINNGHPIIYISSAPPLTRHSEIVGTS